MQSKTANHRNGWICQLGESQLIPGQFDCVIVTRPNSDAASDAAGQIEERIKKEARTIFAEVLNEHKQN